MKRYITYYEKKNYDSNFTDETYVSEAFSIASKAALATGFVGLQFQIILKISTFGNEPGLMSLSFCLNCISSRFEWDNLVIIIFLK